MKAVVQDVVKLEDGKHKGTIKEIQYRTEPYQYVDIVIEEDETKFDIKCGVPNYVSAESALGRILESFGGVLKTGAEIEIDDIIKVGTRVSFTSITENKKGRDYFKIVPTSVKPLE